MSSQDWVRGSGGGCFTGSTLISTPEGATPINELQVGDTIVSFDDKAKLHESKVLKVHIHQDNKVNRYHFWGSKSIDATPNHWVLNQFNTFVAIGSLGSDDCLIDENNHLRPILSVEELGLEEVFNLTVENQHTFIANGIRVHNAGLGAGSISGAGGGGKGGGGAPKEDDDTLFSESKARVVDLLSEGEIVGLVHSSAEQSIYLNDTPLKDSAGNYNFEGVTYATRLGTNSQSYIPGFAGTENSTSVGILVTKDSPGAIIKTFSSTTVDAVRVLLFTPSLLDADNDEGDLHGSAVSFKIYLEKDNNGSWVNMRTTSFTGKTSAKYERSYRLDIPAAWKTSGFTTISIKVERTTADATSTKVQNELYFGSYTVVIDNKLRYPNSALMALQVDARQFTSIPKRSYEIKGVKIKVPSNYTPYDPGHCSLSGYRRNDRCTQAGGTWIGTSVGDNLYSGPWDGTFDIEWTCNPAWILYDLCTDDRYGLGKWLDANQLDKWALYEIGKYCDAVDNNGNFEGVDDGWNNKEARFAANMYLQGREEAFKVLNDIASIFRGMIYWQQGQLSAVQDAPKDPVMNFSDANVIDGAFTYEGTSRKQRHNVAHVTWNNPEDMYRQNVEYVEDSQGIVNAQNQIFSVSVIAVGCTSQGQARRVGKWILYTERYETETVSFSTGMEGAAVRPGDVIKIADSHKSGVRYGGRIATGVCSNTGFSDQSTCETHTNFTGTGLNDLTRSGTFSGTNGDVYKVEIDGTGTPDTAKVYKNGIISGASTAITGVPQNIGDGLEVSFAAVTGHTLGDYWEFQGETWEGSTTSTVYLDAPTPVTAGKTYTMSLINTEEACVRAGVKQAETTQETCINGHIDNEWKPYVWVETKNVGTVGTTESVSEVTVTSAFSNTPAAHYMWILEESGSVEAQDFRVLMTRENGPNIVEISALKYHPAKYGYIEENVSFSSKSTSSLPNPSDPIPHPTNLTISEELYIDSRGSIKNRATFGWDAPNTAGTAVTYPYIASYYVEWRRKAPAITNWTSMGETAAQSITIDDAPAGTLEFRVKTRRIF